MMRLLPLVYRSQLVRYHLEFISINLITEVTTSTTGLGSDLSGLTYTVDAGASLMAPLIIVLVMELIVA